MFRLEGSGDNLGRLAQLGKAYELVWWSMVAIGNVPQPPPQPPPDLLKRQNPHDDKDHDKKLFSLLHTPALVFPTSYTTKPSSIRPPLSDCGQKSRHDVCHTTSLVSSPPVPITVFFLAMQNIPLRNARLRCVLTRSASSFMTSPFAYVLARRMLPPPDCSLNFLPLPFSSLFIPSLPSPSAPLPLSPNSFVRQSAVSSLLRFCSSSRLPLFSS